MLLYKIIKKAKKCQTRLLMQSPKKQYLPKNTHIKTLKFNFLPKIPILKSVSDGTEHGTLSAWRGKTSFLIKGSGFNAQTIYLKGYGFHIAQAFCRTHFGTQPPAGIGIAEPGTLVHRARFEFCLGD